MISQEKLLTVKGATLHPVEHWTMGDSYVAIPIMKSANRWMHIYFDKRSPQMVWTRLVEDERKIFLATLFEESQLATLYQLMADQPLPYYTAEAES